MAPPSSPVCVKTASPRATCLPWVRVTRLIGSPAKRGTIWSDQLTKTPILDGRNGRMAMPWACSVATQSPRLPSFGQLAPPNASTMALALTETGPSAVVNCACPSASKSVNRCRSAKATPFSFSRFNQALSKGDALKLFGKTRPLLPTKVSSPKAWHHSIRSCGSNCRIVGASHPRASP